MRVIITDKMISTAMADTTPTSVPTRLNEKMVGTVGKLGVGMVGFEPAWIGYIMEL